MTAPSGDPSVTLADRRRSWWRRSLLRWTESAAPPLVSAALRLLSCTLRLQYVGMEDLVDRWGRGEPAIVAFWHNRLLVMPIAGRGHPVCVMISGHRDGEMASRVIERWGFRAVRGSSTRGGAAGFLKLLNAFRAGFSPAVVPDGPRGPRYVAKPGVIQLARATGLPIFPVSCAVTRAVQARSWDRLIIPLPFSKVVVVGGEPLTVPREAKGEDLETYRRQLEDRLNDLNRAAEARTGVALA